MSRQPPAAPLATAILVLGLIACGATGGNGPGSREGWTPSGLAWDVSGAGPAVVLVHGAMLDRRQWTPQRLLASQFTLIRYDTRWHGLSAGAEASFRAADDLAEVLDAVGVDRASIVGLSNGARIAVDFALAHPDRVDRLVLASPGLGGYQPVEQGDFWGPMLAALRDGDTERAASLLAASPVMAVGAEDSTWVAAMVRDQAAVFAADPTLEVPGDPPAIRRLGEIQAPTLVITGQDDMRDIALTGDTLQRGIAGARRVVLPGARHLLNISHAGEFNRIVADFLAGRPH